MGPVEHWVARTWMDPERRARFLHRMWLVSLGMLAFGYAVMANHYLGRLHWP